MRTFAGWSLAVAIAGLVVLGAAARADEEKIALDKLPKAVVDAVKAKYSKAQLKSAVKDEKDGKPVYEVLFKLGDKFLELTLSADGKILEEEDKTKEVAAEEEKFPLDKLPKEVVKALKDRFPDCELKGVEEEKGEDGKKFYDVELKYKGGNYEVAVTPEGEITGFEKQIAVKDVPKAVIKALDDKYPKHAVKMVEEVYKVKGKTEKLESYEFALETADKKKMEVYVAPDGKILKAEEEGKKKD